MLLRSLLLLLLLLSPIGAGAEDFAAPRGKVWVQASEEAELEAALEQARGYAEDFEFARVFLTEGGTYAVALGVVAREEARGTLQDLRRSRRIPRDARTADGSAYLSELWTARAFARDGDGLVPDLRAAMELERKLAPGARADAQLGLIWTGDLSDQADGVFGPRTRAAIRAFQARQGALVLGYLTPADAEALAAARADREAAAGWQVVTDGPLGLVTGFPTAWFAGVERTEAGKRLEGTGPARGALLSLISLDGGSEALDNLWAAARDELAADRSRVEERTATSFFLTGSVGGQVIHAFARREGDAVRGFILSHDVAQSDLFLPVAAAMRLSLRPVPVAAAPLVEDQLSGTDRTRPRTETVPRTERLLPRENPRDTPLPETREQAASGTAGVRPTTPRPSRPEPRTEPRREPRPDSRLPRPERPERPDRPRQDDDVDSTGTGFYVSLDGKIVTNHHVVDGCRRMIVDGKDDAKVLVADEGRDLAILQHDVTRGEDEVARFSSTLARLNSDVTVVGYPLYGLLGGLNVTRGVVSSLSGLRGDSNFIQISAEVQPGNSGGPALDDHGYVIGVVQSKLNALKVSRVTDDIPQNINFAIRQEIAREFLRENGISPLEGEDRPALAPADLADAAQKFTVLLQCIK